MRMGENDEIRRRRGREKERGLEGLNEKAKKRERDRERLRQREI